MTARHAVLPSTLGPLTALAEGDALVGLYFPGHTYPFASGSEGPEVTAVEDPVLAAVATQIGEYLDGERTDFDVPVRTAGGDFSERVWARLREIPYGTTTTYGEIARELGGPGLAQQVGQAVGHNPISIIVPCHRVVGADGCLTGYAGGLERKRALLALEEPSAEDGARLF